ncbi:hypothetical protein A3L11_10700 [Thermococcus siculi]|uniref:Uncharacterized protein n=1 Tax=Thermococcus siculi TaxID=72803 RepID=A0A2Z2MSM9_9EURY|nr:hypothetical protein [Thermococcus siculi]ASJ09677.1 hypothetical protein A3L11_10700 [Thermococcus siculi]
MAGVITEKEEIEVLMKELPKKPGEPSAFRPGNSGNTSIKRPTRVIDTHLGYLREFDSRDEREG